MRDRRVSRRPAILAINAALFAAALALASCGSSGNTATSPSTLSKCAVSVDAPGNPLPSSGGSGSLDVRTERECQWTAQPDVTWVSITSGSSGQGSGTVQFTVAANADPATRTGDVMVNGQRAQVTQAAGECKLELSSNATSFSKAGGTGSVDVRASSPLCTWTATSDVDWVSISSNASGKGSLTVGFSVASTTGPPRAGTLTIAGFHFSITQSEGCAYTISPSTFAATPSGGSQVVTVTTSTGCPWTASSNAEWLTLTSSAGSGSGSVGVNVAPTTGPSRTGSLTIAGQMFSVTQSQGCSYDVGPLALSVDASGGNQTVNVNTSSGCGWSASSNASWITIASGNGGSGAGTVTLNVAAADGPARSGTLTIAGQTVTVSQGNGCAFAISPDSQSVASSGGSGSVAVTAPSGCGWSAKSNVSWISITSGGSGSGNGTVAFSVASTNGAARSGTLTIAGKTFTVNQGQGCAFSLSATSATAGSAGGTGTFDVRTGDGCGWSTTSNVSWLSITGGATGSGNGTVRYTVAGNAGPDRTGTISAAGQTFTITQSNGCSISLSASGQAVPAAGGSGSFGVTTTGACAWTAVPNAPWIGIMSGANGNGSGTVQFTVAANTSTARTGTISVDGQTFTVTQESGCSAAVAPDTIAAPAVGGPQNVSITTAAECAWTAASNTPWIVIASTNANGSGNATIPLDIQSNTGPARSGTATIAGHVVTVNQENCQITLTPTSQPASAASGTGMVGVTAPGGCEWTAVSGAAWITITSGASGSGNGTVQFTFEANTTGLPRSGTITIRGQQFTINQAGS